MANHLRDDCRTPRPGPDDPLATLPIHVLDLLLEVAVDERPLLHRTGHRCSLLSAGRDISLSPSPACAGRTCPRACPSCGFGPPSSPTDSWDAGRPRTCPRLRPAGD